MMWKLLRHGYGTDVAYCANNRRAKGLLGTTASVLYIAPTNYNRESDI